MHAGMCEHLLQAAARMKHARLHRAGRNSHDLRDLSHRLFMVVDEIEDLTQRRRQAHQAAPNDRTAAGPIGGDLRVIV